MIEIINLANKPEHIKTVVDWLFSEWGNDNYDYWNCWVRSSLCVDKVPQTFVILVDNRIAGTYSIWRCDLQSRQDLFPWVGGLFVSEKFRGKTFDGGKLGVHLQKHAFSQLKLLGLEDAYGFTEIAGYYEKTGWQFMEMGIDERSNQVRIYKINLT
jgi:hypothetical protein